MTIQVAINPHFTGKIGEDHPSKRKFLNSFENLILPDAKALAREIYKDHSYTAQYAHIPRIRPGKDGSPYTTTYKVTENFIGSNTLSVDLDNETQECSIAYLLTNPFVVSYSSFLYATASSRPDAPRTRIVFEVDQFIDSAETYRLCLTALIRQFGSDESCKDVLKVYAGSPRCQVAFVERVLPMSVLDALVAQEQARLQAALERRRRSSVEQEVLDDNVSRERVLDALRAIPASKEFLSYADWCKLVAAVHSQWPGDDGINMVLAWSPETPVQEVEEMFKSFGNHAGREAQIGTIIYFAKKFGWTDTLKFRDEQQKSDYIVARLLGRAY